MDEGEVFAFAGEAEVGVEFGAADGAVFIGGEDEEESVGWDDGGGGEAPFGALGGAVGEVVAADVDGGGGRVVEFDPVLGSAVGVEDGARVIVVGGGDEFVEVDGDRGEGGSGEGGGVRGP